MKRVQPVLPEETLETIKSKLHWHLIVDSLIKTLSSTHLLFGSLFEPPPILNLLIP